MNDKIYLLALVLIAAALFVYRSTTVTDVQIMPQYVIDGDTFTTTDEERIRLWGIDAPELGTNGGRASKAHLESLIVDQVITCRLKHIDRYSRNVMQCFNRDGDVAAQLVNASMAIDYPQYSDRYYRHSR